MINGCVVGIVEDNRDPDGMHRVQVRFPVDEGVKSSWCRMITPMGGAGRGLVMLPDVGTEVLLSHAYRSLAPFVLGALYNGGADLPAGLLVRAARDLRSTMHFSLFALPGPFFLIFFLSFGSAKY